MPPPTVYTPSVAGLGGLVAVPVMHVTMPLSQTVWNMSDYVAVTVKFYSDSGYAANVINFSFTGKAFPWQNMVAFHMGVFQTG